MAATPGSIDTSSIDAILVAAVSAAVVTNASSKTLYSHSTGTFLGNSSSPPVTADTVFRLASVTKLITTIAGLTLVDKGLVKLEDDLGDILPQLKDVKVATGDGSALVDKERAITLRHLLTHSAGFAYPVMDLKMKRWEVDESGKPINTLDGSASSARQMLKLPLSFQSGKGWMYGPGLDYVGSLVEKLSEISLEDYCRETIFDQFDMQHTTFHPDKQIPNYKDVLIPITTMNEDKQMEEKPDAFPLDIPTEWAAGGHGAYSSANDYAKMLSAILSDAIDGKHCILKKETAEEMFKQQMEDRSYYADIIAEGSPFRETLAGVYDNNDGAGLGGEVDLGLGGSVNLWDIEGRRRKGSINWGGATHAIWWMDKGARLRVFSLLRAGRHRLRLGRCSKDGRRRCIKR